MTDRQTDERLIQVAAWYVIERGMPIYVALQILQTELKDKREFWQASKELIEIIQHGLCTI